MKYYIADLHFLHENIIRHDRRPFSSVDEMTEELVSRWNDVVSSEDDVYVLGDAFWKHEKESIEIIQRLNGHKHLIVGNHDRIKGKLAQYWDSIQYYAEVNDEGTRVILSHYPMPFYNGQYHDAVMLYGHVHMNPEERLLQKWQREMRALHIPCRMYNVGCMHPDVWYKPQTLKEILKRERKERNDG